MSSLATATPSPAAIAESLGKRVIGQPGAVREMAIALSKKLAEPPGRQHPDDRLVGHRQDDADAVGRGLSRRGSAARDPLGRGADPRQRPGRGGRGAAGRARRSSGACWRGRASSSGRAPRTRRSSARAANGLVFVDEVDKIRSHVGGSAERHRHPRAGGAAHPDRERGGAGRPARLAGRRLVDDRFVAGCSSSAPARSRGSTTRSTTG